MGLLRSHSGDGGLVHLAVTLPVEQPWSLVANNLVFHAPLLSTSLSCTSFALGRCPRPCLKGHLFSGPAVVLWGIAVFAPRRAARDVLASRWTSPSTSPQHGPFLEPSGLALGDCGLGQITFAPPESSPGVPSPSSHQHGPLLKPGVSPSLVGTLLSTRHRLRRARARQWRASPRVECLGTVPVEALRSSSLGHHPVPVKCRIALPTGPLFLWGIHSHEASLLSLPTCPSL